MLIQLSTEQKEIMQAQEERLSRLEELFHNNLQPSSPLESANKNAVDASPEGSFCTLELIVQVEEMMDSKIAEANKTWSDNFQQFNDINQAAMIKFSNERWAALDKKIESQLEIFEARTKGLSDFMTKIDRLLDAYPLPR